MSGCCWPGRRRQEVVNECEQCPGCLDAFTEHDLAKLGTVSTNCRERRPSSPVGKCAVVQARLPGRLDG